MDEHDNPYSPPKAPPTNTPPRKHGLAWLVIEAAVAIAIMLALAWLVSAGAMP